MLLVMLAQATLFAAVLIVAPLVAFHRQGLRVHASWGFLAYFACLGIGFIFLEASLIQKLVLFLGYPTRSLSVTLAGLLAWSGLGSLLSERVDAPVPAVRRVGAALVVVGSAYILFLPALLDAFLAAPDAVRVAVALLLLAPLGLLLGTFFPLGIRCLPAPRLVPWAWGVNGVTTVVGTLLAVIIAITYGFTVVMSVALLVYVVGILALGAAVA